MSTMNMLIAPFILPIVLVLLAWSPPGRRFLQVSPRRRWSLILTSGMSITFVLFLIWNAGKAEWFTRMSSWCTVHPADMPDICPQRIEDPAEIAGVINAAINEVTVQLRLPPPLRTCYSDEPAVCDTVARWLVPYGWQYYSADLAIVLLPGLICMGLMAFVTRGRPQKKKNVESLTDPPIGP